MWRIFGLATPLMISPMVVSAQTPIDQCRAASCSENTTENQTDQKSLAHLINRGFYNESLGDLILVMPRGENYVLYSFSAGYLGAILTRDERLIPVAKGGPEKISGLDWKFSFPNGHLKFTGGRTVSGGGVAIGSLVFARGDDERTYRPLSNEEFERIRGNLELANREPSKVWEIFSRLAGGSWAEYGHPVQRLHRFDWDLPGFRMTERIVDIDANGKASEPRQVSHWYDPVSDSITFNRHFDTSADRFLFGSFADGGRFLGPKKPMVKSEDQFAQVSWHFINPTTLAADRTIIRHNGSQSTHGLQRYARLEGLSFEEGIRSLQDFSSRRLAEQRAREADDNGLMGAISGAIMGAATGYADSGGDTSGAIAGAMSGAAVGASGGNDAQYAYMEQRRAEVTADAEANERQLQRTIEKAQSGNAGVSVSNPMPSSSAQISSSSGQTAASTSTASPARQLPYSTLRVVLSADIAQQQGWRDANHQCTAGTEIPIPSDWPDSIAGANAWIEANLVGRFVSACRTAGYNLTGEPQFDVRNGDRTDFVPRSGPPFHHVAI